MYATLIKHFFFLLVLNACSSICFAGLQVGGTRIIFPSTDREASIQVRNEGAEDIMIQSWIEAPPGQDASEVPFAITPSLARLSYKKQQMLRVFYQGEGLPMDRESVFWLSIQEIPQVSKTENSLQVAFRQRLKLFFRPAKLPGTPDEAAKKLKWSFVKGAIEPMLLVNNATAFHVSLGSVAVLAGGKKYTVEAQMVSPNATTKMKINELPKHYSGALSVVWESVNDYGALVKHEADLAL
ncbi:molecular chaperone [Pseudomonas sp. GL93]|uniref:fimbrial biogenesis chaperone n=1 Tax=Pseudomonas sp. GL93 TaxID=2014741 RepID=UPI000E30C190|nr:molecular chaperone [Pseudomonas sp. GL93]RFD23997.1 molecular chaperone [Pseudomonas sp. GL93]